VPHSNAEPSSTFIASSSDIISILTCPVFQKRVPSGDDDGTIVALREVSGNIEIELVGVVIDDVTTQSWLILSGFARRFISSLLLHT
jgi:hypothetical protein